MQAVLVQALYTTLNSLFSKLDTCTICLSEMPYHPSDISLLHTDLLLRQFQLPQFINLRTIELPGKFKLSFY